MFTTYLDEWQVATAPLWHRKLMTAWLSKVVPYLLHASSCGSLSAVEYFIENGQEPNIRYVYMCYRVQLFALTMKTVNQEAM